MTNEEKQAILTTARATLRPLNGKDVATGTVDPQHGEPLQAGVKRRLEDLERKVERRRLEEQRPPQHECGRNLTDYEMARWRQYFETHVADAILAERDFMLEVVGTGIGEREAQLRENIEKMIEAKLKEVPPGPRGERGEAGPAGKLPVVKVFRADTVHYEGDVVVHQSATYQALRDTGRPPPSEDWICLASAGRTPTERGTFDPKVTYRRLDIVTLDKGSFIARHDDPGPCPGDGWQLITAHGAPGEKGSPGPRGERGAQGAKGEQGASIIDWQIDRATYRAVPIMSDGTKGPPLALRGLFEQYDKETR